ncbi:MULTISPECIES: hypothetical protein [unclassified Mycobacterium]|uniref:hypothetical protein n=1 Tax=unclassified Mycobacterium TaxID=2642494 RepID=UPI0029C6E308|nr:MULTISPECIES: hypothetical protein [unclassified Mycobacterium]
MNNNQTVIPYRHAKRVGLALGVAAVAAMAALGLSHGGPTPNSTMLAGSGDAPTNTTYTQPAVSAMNQGATATFTAPGSEPAIASAVPSVKAGG